MKKLICTLVLSFIALSCSNDEESISIVGTWDINQQGFIAADGLLSDVSNSPHGCSAEKDNFSFTQDGIFVREILYSKSASDKVKNNKIASCKSEEWPGSFTITGKIVNTIYSNGSSVGNQSYEILSLTATELKLKVNAKTKKISQVSRGENYITFLKRK